MMICDRKREKGKKLYKLNLRNIMKRKLKQKAKNALNAKANGQGNEEVKSNENSLSRKESMDSNISGGSNTDSLMLADPSHSDKGDLDKKILSSGSVLGKRRATHSTIQKPIQYLPKLTATATGRKGKRDKHKKGRPTTKGV